MLLKFSTMLYPQLTHSFLSCYEEVSPQRSECFFVGTLVLVQRFQKANNLRVSIGRGACRQCSKNVTGLVWSGKVEKGGAKLPQCYCLSCDEMLSSFILSSFDSMIALDRMVESIVSPVKGR
jgi:hypothetical protein